MITYREMNPLDVPVLVGMEKEIYPESPWSAAQFREELAGVPRSRKYIVAQDQNKIIGYAGIALAGDVADIHTLTVARIRTMGEKQESNCPHAGNAGRKCACPTAL
jgi:ribosomal-protein-alanine N-acetyltransferase